MLQYMGVGHSVWPRAKCGRGVQRFVGGCSVARILVADDNSNIQRMVGLALKDQGIDVVAVGNGEAAVRKISDLRPDLVLADVFMPVRNGYEVCQYVKSDPSLAHIPVILLVGAFDPLDEQEAQRVGADGVLKKPFVPPDPLISMVKSALQRAGVAHGHASAAKTPEVEALKGTDLLVPSGATVPMVASIPVQTSSHEPAIAPLDQESFVDEVPAHPEPVRIDSSSQPVAFGSLLETPADEKDDDIGFLPPTHPELVPDRDWRDPDGLEADEETEEEKPAAPWRPEASGNFVSGAPPAPTSATIPEATTPTQAISTAPFAADAWGAASSAASQEKSARETVTAVEEVARVKEREQSSPETVVASAPEATPAEPQTKSSKESWFSVPSNPWNAETQKANRLASAWDAAVPVAAPPVPSNGTEKASEVVGESTQKVIEEAALPAAAVEAIREE